MSLEPPQDNVPEQNQPLEEEEEDKKEKKKPQEQEEEEEEEESKKKSFSPKKRISVTMYGIISGNEKCHICMSAHKFFSNPQNWKYFTYKHVDIMSDKGQKMAKRRGITQMPFFRVRKPQETTDEWIEGYNESEWEGMTKHVS